MSQELGEVEEELSRIEDLVERLVPEPKTTEISLWEDGDFQIEVKHSESRKDEEEGFVVEITSIYTRKSEEGALYRRYTRSPGKDLRTRTEKEIDLETQNITIDGDAQ